MSTTEELAWHYIGKHAIRFEAPDILLTRPIGDMSTEEFRQVAQHVASLPQPEKGFFAIIDSREGGRTDPAALKLPEAKTMNGSQRAVAYLNARYYQRTLVGIFQRAAKLLNFGVSNTVIAFFDTEAEARAWFDTIRSQP